MVNLICFFITAEFTLFSCLFYSPLIQNSRLKHKKRQYFKADNNHGASFAFFFIW
ncbi:hypothetical protein [Wolbachia endosymbiont (group B) of Ennomos erosarius]|uniref:hypothetical protein n=1 Tax=Wolbachia endosymbiont (group B) of Ennomos erosarius TaxID=3066175 RepID=UPI003133112E